VDELNEIMKLLEDVSDEKLQGIYEQNSDLRVRKLSEYSTSDDKATRHTRCFQIGELWAHHLAESVKKTLAEKVPELPVFDASITEPEYQASNTCQTGHSMKAGGDGTSSHEWPDWPEQLHYTAKAHGAYPFWWGGGSDSGDSDLEVYWSEKFGAEKFIHSSCTGQSSWLNGPCVHLLFADGPKGYLYTQDESKCCTTEPKQSAFGVTGPPPGGSETLAPSQGTFWNTFDYKGEVDFNGVYYQGKAKYYVMTGVNEPVREFWYFTDLDGKPVQQGEAGTGPTDQGYPVSIGHTIWHDYNPSSLDSSAFDTSVFDIPAACKSTTLTCAFP
jgi:hypothetical protein